MPASSVHSNVLKHVFETALVVVNLLLHLALVLLEVGEALLQQGVLLLLIRDGCVVSVADQLQTWHNMGHVVLVH